MLKKLLCVLLSLCLLAGCAAPKQNSASHGESPEAVSPFSISDKGLEDRALYLLDPYILPVSWWTGSGIEMLDPVYIKPSQPLSATDENNYYYESSRFRSLAEIKKATEQVVTKEYAEAVLYPEAEKRNYFLEDEGKLYCNALMGNAYHPMKPISATVISRSENEALLSVNFRDDRSESVAYQVPMRKENHTWKLASTPYLPYESKKKAAVDDPIPSDEELIDRLFYLFDYHIIPVFWWNGATGYLDVQEIDHAPLEDTPPYATFFQVKRFDRLYQMKRATEQVVTKEYAETFLYPYLELNQQFLERDEKLYINTNCGLGAWPFAPDSAAILSKDADNALLSVLFKGPYDEEETIEIAMKRENDLWKLCSTPYVTDPQDIERVAIKDIPPESILDEETSQFYDYFDDLLACGLAANNWTKAENAHPDMLIQFFSKRTELNRLSTDAEPAVVSADIVEPYLQLYFDVTPEHLRESSFYLPDQNSYEVPIVSRGTADVRVTSIKEMNGSVTIAYSFYDNDRTLFRTSEMALRFMEETLNYKYQFCHVTDVE